MGSWKLPRGALVKKVLGMILDHRYVAFGERLTGQFADSVAEDGSVDWPANGIHELCAVTPGTDAPVNGVSKSGEAAKPFPGGISAAPSETISCNWSDTAATLTAFPLVFADHECLFKDDAVTASCRYEGFAAEIKTLYEKYGDMPPSPAKGLSGPLQASLGKGASSTSVAVNEEIQGSKIGKKGCTKKARQPKALPMSASLLDLSRL